MQCKEIIRILEEQYPKTFALSWDNVGLLAGRDDKEVHKIYVALDADNEVIEHAIACKADMLITHHPMIFSAMKSVNNQDFIGKRVLALIQNDISYYAMHTNYDVLGMAALSGRMMQLKEQEVLEITRENECPEGIGRIGTLKNPMSLAACASWVKELFELPFVNVCGDLEAIVSRAAISPGAGKSMIAAACEREADVLITGDIDHHAGIDAVDQGLMIIDAGHYGLEHIFIKDIEAYLRKQVEQIEVETEPVSHPFHVL